MESVRSKSKQSFWASRCWTSSSQRSRGLLSCQSHDHAVQKLIAVGNTFARKVLPCQLVTCAVMIRTRKDCYWRVWEGGQFRAMKTKKRCYSCKRGYFRSEAWWINIGGYVNILLIMYNIAGVTVKRGGRGGHLALNRNRWRGLPFQRRRWRIDRRRIKIS